MSKLYLKRRNGVGTPGKTLPGCGGYRPKAIENNLARKYLATITMQILRILHLGSKSNVTKGIFITAYTGYSIR